MGVRSRRLRSAMSDFRPACAARFTASKIENDRYALGAVRDEDVALVALEELKAYAKGAGRRGIQIIADEQPQASQSSSRKAQDSDQAFGYRSLSQGISGKAQDSEDSFRERVSAKIFR